GGVVPRQGRAVERRRAARATPPSVRLADGEVTHKRVEDRVARREPARSEQGNNDRTAGAVLQRRHHGELVDLAGVDPEVYADRADRRLIADPEARRHAPRALYEIADRLQTAHACRTHDAGVDEHGADEVAKVRPQRQRPRALAAAFAERER